jgi:hypothetical protein
MFHKKYNVQITDSITIPSLAAIKINFKKDHYHK